MDRLLSLKTALSELEALGFSALDSRDDTDDSDEMASDDGGELAEEEMLEMMDRIGVSESTINKLHRRSGVSKQEVMHLLMQAAVEEEGRVESLSTRKAVKEEKSEKAPPREVAKSTPISNGKTTPKFELVEPEFVPRQASISRKNPKTPNGQASASAIPIVASDFLEPTGLSTADLADKTARTRALQFHTNKIAKHSRKTRSSTASRDLGGDDDLPYRNVEKQRKERSLADEGWGGVQADQDENVNDVPLLPAKKRTWGARYLQGSTSGSDLGDGDDSDQDERMSKKRRETPELMNVDGPTTEYLALVKSAKKKKKEEKRAAFDAQEAEKGQVSCVQGSFILIAISLKANVRRRYYNGATITIAEYHKE